MSADGDRRDEAGFTLVELMVSMVLLVVLSAVSITAVNLMFKDVRRQQGQSDNLDAGRRAVALLDRQVRYASTINAPGPGLTTDGSQWVDWQQTSPDPSQPPTCYQWRWEKPTGRLLFRSWRQSSTGTVTLLTGWNLRATGVAPLKEAGVDRSIFALPSPTDPTTSALKRTQLTVAFTSSHGKPVLVTDTQVTLTALNSSAPGAGTPTFVCQGKVRSP